jgi:ketosteroid isomerase-like protein
MMLTEEAIAAITSLHHEWIRREQTGAAGAVVDLCTDDVVLMPPGQAPVIGRAPVAEWLDQPGPEVMSIGCEIRRLRGDASVAYKLASFRTTMRDRHTGRTQLVSGSHLWVLERSAEGQWLVGFVTWSVDG